MDIGKKCAKRRKGKDAAHKNKGNKLMLHKTTPAGIFIFYGYLEDGML